MSFSFFHGSIGDMETNMAAISLTPRERLTSWRIILSLPPSEASLLSATDAAAVSLDVSSLVCGTGAHR